MMLFSQLLDTKEVVPAIILPFQFPNRKTWETLRQWISPLVTGTS